ncbi:uncharacterized protein LOC132732603 [Ruditapes philippinarum]|uniref:uncharacterized protein LOC132732603 n=1 Tax=Ruditapes philippinarum TaxID=129788 RepID=UPI00295B4592|nr:uncharacterized protein LOC132732603 [Ruditapes philippinarum]
MTRTMIRVYVREILRRTGRVSLICMETGPSDKWFRGFLARHPQLSERTPENLDKSRARMSSQNTMDGWFELLKKVLRDKKLENKEGQIFNVDEVGWSGKERKKVKVFGQKGAHCFAANNITSCEHVTVNMCICADGRILPPMIIYKESLPHRSMHDGIPGSWLYGKSENGYMDGDLFLTWFKEIFLINCGRERPVLLVMDNHDSHVTLPLVETARLNDVVLLGLPAHTTYILQPLDVKVNGPLKTRFSNLATHLGFANPSLSIGRSRFPVVLRHAIEQTTPSSVRQAFVATGIVPYNPQAIDKSQLVPATFTKTNEQTGEKENSNVKTCEACGSFLTNPLVDQGVIPQSMAQVLVPPPRKTTGKLKSSRIVTEGRVISGDEMLKKLEEKEEVMRRQMEEKEERLRLKEQRKQQKEKEGEEKVEKKKRREAEKKKKEQELKEERMKKAVGGRLAHKRFTCAVCGERGRVNDEVNGVMWYGCDDGMCGRWYHEECLGQSENEYLKESESDGMPWYCAVCKPWLYEEE